MLGHTGEVWLLQPHSMLPEIGTFQVLNESQMKLNAIKRARNIFMERLANEGEGIWAHGIHNVGLTASASVTFAHALFCIPF